MVSPAEGALWKSWRRVAQRQPRQVVLIDAPSGRMCTAHELTGRALGFGEMLSRFRAGDRVAFRLPNGVEWMAFFLALQRAGLAAIPLDGALPAAGCLEMAQRFGAMALFVDGKLQRLEGSHPERRAACLKVTSGSDGTAKIIECLPEHLVADGRQVAGTMKISANDWNLGVIPFGHSYGLGNLVMPLILQGTAIVAAAEYVPRQLVEWMEEYRVTIAPLVPALFRVLAALPAGPKLGGLRTAISAGAMLPPSVAQDFHARYGIKIHNFYGSSETGGICYDRSGAASLTGRSVGKPLRGVAIALKKGAVVVKSAAVAMPGGKWTLNDTAEWSKTGELVLLGRRGEQANIGGKKVHPQEVERVLRSFAEVSDAAVWLERGQGRDLLAAAVETRWSRAQLDKALAEKLPDWKLPRKFFVARELPRTERGKLDRGVLRERVG